MVTPQRLGKISNKCLFNLACFKYVECNSKVNIHIYICMYAYQHTILSLCNVIQNTLPKRKNGEEKCLLASTTRHHKISNEIGWGAILFLFGLAARRGREKEFWYCGKSVHAAKAQFMASFDVNRQHVPRRNGEDASLFEHSEDYLLKRYRFPRATPYRLCEDLRQAQRN